MKVTGLKPGKYEVSIGGTQMAQLSADELEKGVNLATAVLAAGPIAEQVKAVKAAVEAKNLRRRPELDLTVRKVLEMKACTVEIKPVK